MLNYGNGTFSYHSTYPSTGGPSSVAAADLDNDGDLDIVTAEADGYNVAVLMNQAPDPTIPTLSPWGGILAVLFLLTAGALLIVRMRNRAQDQGGAK